MPTNLDQPIDLVLRQLKGVEKRGEKQWAALCPSHDDNKRSLSISVGADQRVLLKCHAGCKFEDIVADLGLTKRDLFGGGRTRGTTRQKTGRIVATYNYVDRDGALLYQAVRYDPKDFRQRRPDGRGGWLWRMGNVTRVLYHLPEIVTASPQKSVYIVEGEKDVDRLRSHGLLATCSVGGVGGAGRWAKKKGKWEGYAETLWNRRTVIIPDNDVQGIEYAENIAHSLYNIAASIKVLEPLEKIPKYDISDWLNAGHAIEELARLAENAPEWTPRLPTITVSNRQLPAIVTEVLSALSKANNPPSLFTKATNPTRLIVDENGRPIAQQLQMAAWQGVIADVAIFQKVNTKGDLLNTFPNGAIVKATMTRPPSELPFPPLLAIIQIPVVRPDGSLLLEPGYDSLTRLYYAPSDGLNMPSISTKPTKEQVQKAFRLFREPIAEFPFVAEADAANALALLLTPLVRPMLPHGVPMALLDKPERGTGASLLAEVVALLATGHPAPMMKAPEYEEEWDKRITAMLLEGRTLVVIDNVDAPLQSQALSLALTSDVYSGRRLGYSQQLALPHRIIWVATGNNISFKDSDMPRRCYRVRLDAGMAQPWLHRKGFRHPRLKQWLSKYRGRILCAALTIIRAWIQSGKPLDKSAPIIGSYEDWCETLGGILKFVGQEGFLGNLDELYEEDTGRSEWDRWIEALRETFGERRFTAAQVASQLSPSKSELLDALPTNLTEARRRGGSFTKSLGRALNRHKGHATVNGLIQRRVSSESEGRKHGWSWRIVERKKGRRRQDVFDFFQKEKS